MSARCHACRVEITSYRLVMDFALIADERHRTTEAAELSCGCVVEWPEFEANIDCEDAPSAGDSVLVLVSDMAGNPAFSFVDTFDVDEDA